MAAAPGVDLSTDPIYELLRVTRAHLHMDVAFVGEFEAGKRVFRYVSCSGSDDRVVVGDAYPLEETYCEKVAAGRITGLISDATLTPEVRDLRLTDELDIRAYLATPIVLSSGRLYGTLCCFSKDAKPTLGQAELDVLRLVARLMAERLESNGDAHEEQLCTLARIEECLAGDQPTMVFQPIVALDTGCTVGFEALARLAADPERSPHVWFSDAHPLGLGVDLEVKAVAAAVVLDQLPEDVYLSVNVGAETLCSEELEAELAGVAGHRMVLELTEHEAIRDPQRVGVVLERYRARGIRLAVDDMGAGYAGLTQLLNLAPDIIKMDGSLTRDVDVDPARRSLAHATVEFAASVGAEVIAEGVEHERELETLRDLGMSAAQGFFLGQPVEAPWEIVDPGQRLIWPSQSQIAQFVFKPSRDFMVVFLVGILGFVLSSVFDGFDRISRLGDRLVAWQVDEIPIGLSVMTLSLAVMGMARGRQLLREVARRREASMSSAGPTPTSGAGGWPRTGQSAHQGESRPVLKADPRVGTARLARGATDPALRTATARVRPSRSERRTAAKARTRSPAAALGRGVPVAAAGMRSPQAASVSGSDGTLSCKVTHIAQWSIDGQSSRWLVSTPAHRCCFGGEDVHGQ